MKKVLSIINFVLCAVIMSAQTDGITYQAVIIDENVQEIPGVDISGNFLKETDVAMLFTIMQGEQIEYQEEHITMTDDFGMINILIGSGIPTIYSQMAFDEIHWDGSERDLKVDLSFDVDALDYQSFSREELTYVPYAYHRNIEASGWMEIDGETTLNSSLLVANESLSHLTGEVQVDGVTNLGSDLNVLNQANTLLSGDLQVLGDAQFDGGLTVQDLVVENETDLYGPVQVHNASTDLNGTLAVEDQTWIYDELYVEDEATFDGGIVNEGNSDLNGQVWINADINGDEMEYGSYPLVVEGSNQGILIDVDGTVNESKNFLTFVGDGNYVHGCIEGQTLGELHGSYRFIWDVVMGGIQEGMYVAEAIACGTQLDFAESAVNTANTVVAGVQWVELTAYYELNVGINFKTGGADYAEFLEREDPNEVFYPGDIVGVRGGKISKYTRGADHTMVISTSPIVLGNMPIGGDESLYEKVGFLGQVPVRVVGKVDIGDYIIASGNHDGLAIAVKPADLPTDKFGQIVGVSWEASENEGMNVVNVAIGLNSNDLANKVSQQEKEIAELKQQVELILAAMNGDQLAASAITEESNTAANEENSISEQLSKSSSTREKLSKISDEEFEKYLQDNGHIFTDKMTEIKNFFDLNAIDYSPYPEIEAILNDPVNAIRDMRNGEYLDTYWQSLEARYFSKSQMTKK